MNSPFIKRKALLNAMRRLTNARSAFTPINPSRKPPALFVFAVLTALLCAAAIHAQVPTHGAFGQTPDVVQNGSAVLVSHLEPAQMLRLAIVLTQPHPAAEQQFLRDVQNVQSPLFHHFLSNDEWNTRFAPSAADEQAVVDWATSQGLTVTNRFPNRFLVDVEAPAGTIEKALSVVINNYQLGAETHFSNDRDPVLPATVATIVDSVLGLNSLEHVLPKGGTGQYVAGPRYSPGPPKADLGASSADAASAIEFNGSILPNVATPPSNYWRPSDMFSSTTYNYGALMRQGHCCNPLNNPGSSPPEASIAIAAYGDVAFSDIAGFQAGFSSLAILVHKYAIDGGYTCGTNDANCIETTLDTEWSLAMANSQSTSTNTAEVYVYEGANSNSNTVVDVLTFMVNGGLARVMSTSWGCAESTCLSASSMNAMNALYSEMVGKGWTLVAASGDQGATAGCGTTLAVQYPASDPNVTGIGGTKINEGTVNSNYEVAWTGGTGKGSCSSNNGGSTGGFSSYWKASSAPFQGSLAKTYRAVPDMSLDSATGHDVYFNGGWIGSGGTSIAAPMMAGFFAQENAYLLTLGNICGPGAGTSPCAPMGNANYPIYSRGFLLSEGLHISDPFYDITSGCNSNDITAANNLTAFCAGTGFDEVTGWGSANMLQLAWAINSQLVADDFGSPIVQFSGPSTAKWYNSDQVISWTIKDNTGLSHPGSGIAGFSQGWDFMLPDSLSKPHGGTRDSFYNGPQFPNVTSGCLSLLSHGCGGGGLAQGCHVAHVQAWNNQGLTSGDQTFGPFCYDSEAPYTSASLQGTFFGNDAYVSPVTLYLSANDAESGVAATYYSVNGGFNRQYIGPNTFTAFGAYTIAFYSVDVAGNVEATQTTTFSIKTTTATSLTSSLNSSTYGQTVLFTTKVVPQQALPAGTFPTGTVTFMNGATALGTASLNSGVAMLSFAGLPAGTDAITAVYPGDGHDTTSTSSPLSQKVKQAASTTTLTTSQISVVYGTQVKLTASISSADGGPVSGTVTFKDGSTVIGAIPVDSSQNTAVFPTEFTAGSHPITASYSGSTNDLPSASAVLTEIITPDSSSVVIESTGNPSAFGQPGNLWAVVTSSGGGPISGTVTFMDGTTELGTAPVIAFIGKSTTYLASWDISGLSVGSHLIKAAYGGNADDSPSTSPVFTQVVNQEATTTTLSANPNPGTTNKVVTLNAIVATVDGQPITAGTVMFFDGSSYLGVASLSSSANAFIGAKLAAGQHSITAAYQGSVNDMISTSAVVTVVINAVDPPPPPCKPGTCM
jgi:hypothetical protein